MAYTKRTNQEAPYCPIFRYDSKDGTTKWILCQEDAIQNADGQPRVDPSINTNITIHTATERKLQQTLTELDLIYMGTKIVSEASEFIDALQKVVDFICEVIHWPVGHVYLLNHEGTKLVSSSIWGYLNKVTIEDLKTITDEISFERGVGLPGLIWGSMAAVWFEDILSDSNGSTAAYCEQLKLHGAVGFPIIVHGKVIAVCEFFSYDYEEKHSELLRAFQLLGEQIGLAFERKEIESQLDVMAHFDAVTTLPNRAYFHEMLERAIHKTRRTKKEFALLYLDLDDFKKINDSLGHSMGDELLKYASKQIRGAVRVEDFVARLGGDEFVILLDGAESTRQIMCVVKRIIEAFKSPYYIDIHELNTSVSIGIAKYPTSGDDASSLMKNADVAMYSAKSSGKNTYQFFSDELNEEHKRQSLIESHLRHAIERDEFSLVYQPQLTLQTGKVSGFEVLLRWNPLGLGQISPAEFIPAAENMGLIPAIGEWVLDRSCQQFQSWISQYQWFKEAGLLLSVNLSVLQLTHGDFALTLSALMDRLQFKPTQLVLEVTETAIMTHLESSTQTLKEINQLGIGIAIDDFGTGYSSLSYLKQLPFSTLKIDQSFVQDLISNQNDASIITAIIQLGKALDLDIVAEGIETEPQLSFLKQAGCHVGQGYGLSYPLPPEELIKFIEVHYPRKSS